HVSPSCLATLSSPPPPIVHSIPSLHDALPISDRQASSSTECRRRKQKVAIFHSLVSICLVLLGCDGLSHSSRVNQWSGKRWSRKDRKSTRLNSSHVKTSYAVFCLKRNRLVSGR